MVESFTTEQFTRYFFGDFACIMVDNTLYHDEFWKQDQPVGFWKSAVLGCFYVATHSLWLIRRSNQTILVDAHMSATLGTACFSFGPD